MIMQMNDISGESRTWNGLSYEQKNHELFLRQKRTLDMFLERNAISKAQYDKSLRDLSRKMGETA